MTLVFCAALATFAQAAPSQQIPHPAVVRVIAPERGGTSCGSGALVAANETYGLVVTNWHVVRDAKQTVVVVFPDGFRSGARVLATDRHWDLAALAIWRPNVQPIALAERPPQPGEPLTIAGYGRGSYRAAMGRCTQYVSPGHGLPFEMVELSTAARQGDSGGPILNQRGELAGVLFGAGFGRTAGAYCGRVRWFLDSAADDFLALPSQSVMLAQNQARPLPGHQRLPDSRPEPVANATPVAAIAANAQPRRPAQITERTPASRELSKLPGGAASVGPVAEVPAAGASAEWPDPAAPAPTRVERIKTMLAAIGVLAILFHALRLLGAAAGA
jgi:hypothetical protein